MSDRERAIFCFHDGVKNVYVDPLAALAAIHEAALGLGKTLEDISRNMGSANPDLSIPAETQAVLIVRQAFKLPEIDPSTGEGFTREFVMQLYSEFFDWLEKKKTGTGVTPTSPQLTA